MADSAREKLFANTVVTIVNIITIFITVFGNFVVIYVMTRERKLRRKSNFYVISVAFADLLKGNISLKSRIKIIIIQL